MKSFFTKSISILLFAISITTAYSQTVTTLAGSGIAGSANSKNTPAQFYYPAGVAVDAAGNVYVADQLNNIIRKITPSGVVTTLAGSGAQGSANGTGTAAQFSHPTGIAVDDTGNVYVADQTNNMIRKITPAGVVTTLAGNGLQGYVNATGTAAQFYAPYGVAVDTAGNVYVGDTGNNKIRVISSSGAVTTLAGSFLGYADGTGTAAKFNSPSGVTVDDSGNVYVADFGNNMIRKISSLGVVTTLAGNTTSGYADGTGTAAQFYFPNEVAVDTAGNVYVADLSNNMIRKISSLGVVTTLAGGSSGFANGTGTAAKFNQPRGVAIGSSGNVYVADAGNNMIREISPKGVVTTLAGTGVAGFANDTVIVAQFNNPEGLVVDDTGNVYVADNRNNMIRKVSPAGIVTTLAGSGAYGKSDGTGTAAQFNNPTAVALDTLGNVYVADSGNAIIRKVTPGAVVTTPAAPAFNTCGPDGIAVDDSDNIYITDVWHNVILKVSPSGAVSTLAGNATVWGYADGTGAAAEFLAPTGVAVDAAGNVYVADTYNNVIRKISPLGVVTTLAGTTTAGYADGVGTAAQFNHPWGIAVDAAGNVYVADTYNNMIREISPAGVVTTLAGTTTAGYADGVGTAARFNRPWGIAVDTAGNVYVGDAKNNRIRKITNIPQVVTAIITPQSGSLNIQAYPNPTNGTITITAPEAGQLTIYNTLGEAVTIQTIQAGNTPISLDKVPAGVYTLILTGQNSLYTPTKVIKN